MVVYAVRGTEGREESRALLAQAVFRTWGLSPLPELCRQDGGKPRFSAHPEHQFNLSHSGPYALCALGESPVGADIQVVKRTWRETLPRRVCSPAELRWLEEQPDYWSAFTALWCLKEARVKYTGAGLGAGLRETAVPLPEGGRDLYRLDRLWFRLYTGPDFRGAVCGEEPPPEEMIWI